MFDYEVGKQVVCIDMGPWTNFDTGKRVKFQTPIMDMVYTIRSLQPFPWDMHGLRFEEIRNEPAMSRDGMMEPSFHVVAFRPVRPTSIDIFTEILKKTPTPEKPLVTVYGGGFIIRDRVYDV